jgi:CheY-like chemotaxis protein
MSERIKILIVDDKPEVLEVVVETVQIVLEHAEIKSVTNSKDALLLIEAEKVDLLITDFYMPGIDGLSLVKRLQNLEDYQIPKYVLMLSDFVEPGDASEDDESITYMPKTEMVESLPGYLKEKAEEISSISSKNAPEVFALRPNTKVKPSLIEPVRIDILADNFINILKASDISLKGIGVKTNVFQQNDVAGKTYDFLASFPNQKSFKFQGQVVKGDEDPLYYRIEYSNISSDGNKILEDYIKDRLNKISAA